MAMVNGYLSAIFKAGCLQKTNRALPVTETEKGSYTAGRRNRNSNTAHYENRTQEKNTASYSSLDKQIYKQPFRRGGNTFKDT